VKALIVSLSLFVLGKGTDVRRRAAKSASIGILARTIAEQMNLKDEFIRQVEIGGLLAQLGMNVLDPGGPDAAPAGSGGQEGQMEHVVISRV
jgi:hypothetical protein